MGTVAIVDYGVGNLKSVANALSYLGCSSCITADPAELERADAIILPGVGAFPDAADRLRSGGLDQHVLAQGQKKPVLGICLGMQLLLERSFEYGEHPGLGLIPGEVRPIRDVIPAGLAVPHMGWNALRFPAERPRSPIFAPLTAAVQRGNVYGTQFHPEKSGDVGLRILKAFCGLEG